MKTKLMMMVLMMCLSFASFAQKKTVVISEKDISLQHRLKCQYAMRINKETNDTVTYVYVAFQNSEYTTIIDIASILFDVSKNRDNVKKFTKTLKDALQEMGNKTTIEWDEENYRISLYDFSKSLYLRESRKKGDGYTILPKSKVEDLISWLESNGF